MAETLAGRMIRMREERRLERIAAWRRVSVEDLLAERSAQELESQDRQTIEDAVQRALGGVERGGLSREVEKSLATLFERIGRRVLLENSGRLAREVARRIGAVSVVKEGEEVPEAVAEVPARIPIDDIQSIIDHVLKNSENGAPPRPGAPPKVG